MRGVRVDPAARADGGATWGHFNAATHAFGLATTGGILSTTEASADELARLVRLTERYCVVLQTIAKGPSVSVSAERG